MSLEETARELYGMAPADFTAARNTAAKEARAGGDRGLAEQVQRLRKPTTAGWLLNVLVRRRPEQVDEVLALGTQLRAAQGVLTGDELRALDVARRRLTRAVADQARVLAEDAGHAVGDQVVAAVEESLRAAMADPGGASALATGLLTDGFTSTGLDPVEVEGLVAVPSAARTGVPSPGDAGSPQPDRTVADGASPPQDAAPDPAQVAAAREAVEHANSGLDEARRSTEEAGRSVADARGDEKRLAEQRRELLLQLREVDEAIRSAETAREAAERRLARAEHEEATASDAVRQAEDALAALTLSTTRPRGRSR